MKKTIIYCDICGNETKDSYAIDVKWWSDAGYQRYDICNECKERTWLFVSDEEIEKRNLSQRGKTFLGFLRMIFKNK
ncbi:hypothetical protein PQE75_gp134 [Bacillus phage vB_BcoS-136]|uniref:Uncharacterized protein n=1 Tax=Bacillus phage vB_BcoS-136 TaxID=2419619 RepID=A0A3G3BVQ4_9CAUD|nr:hypothetical protein PQE75_gp134 [Bacillus phage vB_BcoS-136]AYP68345.1 hypothetical protein vBBcoS136_00231 [Bacillus phage vB_BcoS-136]